MSGGYEQVGSSSDISNVNPMTGQFFTNLQSDQSQIWNQLQGATPLANLQGLGGQVGAIGGMAQGLMGGYGGGMNALALAQARQAGGEVASGFGGMNALGSGAYQKALYEATSTPFLQAATQLGQMQTNLAGTLAQQYLAGGQAQYGTLASLYGQGMAVGGQLASPEWYEPTYSYKPGFGDYAAPLLGAAGGALLGGPFGAAMGASMFGQKPTGR